MPATRRRRLAFGDQRANPTAEFLPCPPAHRGREVSAEAMAHPSCTVIAAKAFLLHAQNAALEWVLSRA